MRISVPGLAVWLAAIAVPASALAVPQNSSPAEKGSSASRPATEEPWFRVGFVTSRTQEPPDTAKMRKAAKRLRLGALPESADVEAPASRATDSRAAESRPIRAFDLPDGASLVYGVMPLFPDEPITESFLTPTAEEMKAARATIVVTVVDGPKEPAAAALLLVRALATVAAGTDAVAVRAADTAYPRRAKEFCSLARESSTEVPPVALVVDVTYAQEGKDRISVLTHGLGRFGREEFLVGAPKAKAGDATEFAYMMAMWMVADPEKELPTGDTVGRTMEEKIRIKRVPNPVGGKRVVRLDL